MKILVRNTDNVVIYAQNDLVLDTEAHGDGWVDRNFNTQNAMIVDATPPPLWVGAVWSYNGSTWSVADQARYDLHLAELQTPAWERIKSSRDQRKNGGVLVNGKWFHTDSDSRIQQLGLVLMGAAVPAVAWKTMDGTFTTMSQALAGQIFTAVAALDMSLFANAEAHRAAMEASANPSVYDFSAGWPAHYPI